MEIRAGTGGDEAALFAGDLYDMYTRYARDAGLDGRGDRFSPGEAGGFKEVVFSVDGRRRLPAPALRVRRAPRPAGAEDRDAGPHPHVGGDRGVLPEPDEVQVEINPAGHRDGSGCGPAGPAGSTSTRPRAPSASGTRRARPDEMEVKCQDERSQHKNYDRAMRILRSRLFERQQEKLHQERAEAAARR